MAAEKRKQGTISPRRKGIIGVVLMLVLVALLWIIMLFYNVFGNLDAVQLILKARRTEEKYEDVADTIGELAESFEEAYDNFYTRIQVNADLSAKALYSTVSQNGDDSIAKLSNGSVVKIENGEITLPNGTRTGIKRFAPMITGDKGRLTYDTTTAQGTTRRDILVYSHITGPYYYVEIVKGNLLRDYADWYVGYESLLMSMEQAYHMGIILVCPDRENSRFFSNATGNLIYYKGAMLGEDIVNTEDVGLPSDPAELMKTANHGSQVIVPKEIEELDCVLLMVVPEENAVYKAVSDTIAGSIFITLLCIVFLVWIISVYQEMFGGTMTEEKKEKYSPSNVKKITASIGVIGLLTVFAGSLFVRTLSNVYQETNDLNNSIDSLQMGISLREHETSQARVEKKNLYIEYGQRLAELLEKYPQLNEKEMLKQLSSTVGAAYIMVFDAYGREVSTSSEYINMELATESKDMSTSTADFRRILHGVPSIAHDAAVDEITGRNLELVGVRTNDRENGGYGVLLLAMRKSEDVADEDLICSVMESLTPVGKICFSIDPSSKLIREASSGSVFAAYSSDILGVKDSDIRGGVSDFMTIAGQKCFCVSKADEEMGRIYYFCTPNSMLFENGIKYAATCVFGCGIVFALLCAYLLSGYTDEALARAEEEKKEQKKQNENRPLSKAMSYVRHWLGKKTPEAKAFLAARILVAIYILNTYWEYKTASEKVQEAYVFNYILAGKWNRGINLFSIMAAIMLFCAIMLGMLLVRFVLSVIGNMMNPRGKTICKLIANLIGYLSIIVFIYYALSYFGVDTNAILASVGVMGIGLTMGARDLIADIFAGISLIFGGEYQVGDIVSIDGYRGMVQEVGVRTTKVKGRGGNIRTFGNKDIKNVINLTKLNSWVPITIRVDVNYPLRDVEAILTQTLPRVGQEHPEIISGPYYKGVLSVEAGFAVLSIIAECNEDNYHKVERAMVREVLLALREKNVPVR